MATPNLTAVAGVMAAAATVTAGVWTSEPPEFWIALAAGVLIVVERHKEKSMLSRLSIAAISAGIGFSLAGELAAITGRSKVLAVMILTTMGYLVIETVSDRKFIREILAARLGGKK